MSKMTKRLSLTLAVAMILGLLSAFPVTAKQALPDVSTKATLINVAGSATYKGSDMTNGVGNYGEANWDVYHTGKLNDGVIATDATNNTTGKNVETHINGYAAGTTYVTFKLAKSERVSVVDVYTNCRTTGGNRGYPASVKVYVGNSEDVASATLLGEATTTDTGYIRKYTATGELSGEYVIIELGITTPTVVIALTEVEITAIQSPADVRMNHAPKGKYRGTGETNGKVNFGEDNWDEFSAGKLNDGVIANDRTDNTQGQNVEIQNPEYAKGGTFYLFFAFSYEVRVSDLSMFFNARDSYGRGYPTSVKAYVNGDDRLYDATYIGELTYTAPAGQDAPWVREYKCTCEGTESGTFVIFEMTIDDSTVGVGLTEVEIYGYGAPITHPLSTPKINEASDTPVQTFDAPTISWDKVSMAQGYDIYIDGVKVVENWQSTSYTVSAEPSDAYNSATAYSQIQVVAKGDYFWYTDSARSESYKYFYCKKPVDSNGKPVTEADFIIDPGHGGSQPGAINGERNEKDDTLAMSLKVGSMLEELGYTVAYTRITDVNVGLMARAIQGNVGNFKAFICIHRNSFTAETANGVETLHQTGDANDEAFAQLVQDELMALGLFTNRGLKPRDNLVVLNNTKSTLPTILVELAFISNTNDNELFDEYNDDIAFAIAKGAMKQIGGSVEYSGIVKVDGTDYEVDNDTVTIGGISFNDYDEDVTVDVKLDITHTFGVKEYQCSIDGEQWTTLSDDGKATINLSGLAAGDYTLQFRIVHDHEAYKVYTATDIVLTVGVGISEIEYGGTVTVGGTDYTVDNAPIEVGTIELDNFRDGYIVDVELDLTHTFGVKGYQYTLDGENWLDIEDGKVGIDFTAKQAGDYTVEFRLLHNNDAYSNTVEFLTVKVTVPEVAYSGTVTVGGVDYTVDNAPVEVDSVVLNDYKNGYVLDVELDLTHTYGVKGYQYTLDGENWLDIEDGKLGIDFTAMQAGDYTVEFRLIHNNDAFSDTVVCLTIKANAEEKTLMGDFNQDGFVNTLDAAYVLKYVVELDIGEVTDRMLYAGDVDSDGAVLDNDASIILKYCAGLIDELPCDADSGSEDETAE